jgi:hypothetical protein
MSRVFSHSFHSSYSWFTPAVLLCAFAPLRETLRQLSVPKIAGFSLHLNRMTADMARGDGQ